jgi:Rrf2 family protein
MINGAYNSLVTVLAFLGNGFGASVVELGQSRIRRLYFEPGDHSIRWDGSVVDWDPHRFLLVCLRAEPQQPQAGQRPESAEGLDRSKGRLALQVTAKTDYAIRAASELARAAAQGTGPLKGDWISESQGIPKKFMENILNDLKRAGIVRTQRGASGGYWLAPPPGEVSLADVIRAVEGPLANVRGEYPEDVEYPGAAENLREVWIALRANMRAVLESVTLADLADGDLPAHISRLTTDPEAWVHH